MMMGIYNNKDTGIQQNIIETVKVKQNSTESHRSSSGYWSKSQYNSTIISNIEESLLSKPLQNIDYIRRQF
jgi:hypothetical protein